MKFIIGVSPLTPPHLNKKWAMASRHLKRSDLNRGLSSLCRAPIQLGRSLLHDDDRLEIRFRLARFIRSPGQKIGMRRFVLQFDCPNRIRCTHIRSPVQ
ncbi:hypothetical protein [Variovorax boronicumulans]|uniref:hypothetical protein n=1 Tax=Variovorax boronicumulans TaxID=436515 RepID=UPI0027D7BDBA|nr:hypothetical protein [Variovorax boronicumulans]